MIRCFMLSRHHRFRAIFVANGFLAIQSEVQPGRQVLPSAPRRIFSPGSNLDKLSDGGLTTLGLAEYNRLVDLVRDFHAKIRVQKCLLLRSQLVPRIEEQGHRLLKIFQKLGMPRRTRTQLLRSELDSRDGVGVVPVATVANEFYQLESQQSKVQASVLVQDLMNLSALEIGNGLIMS